MYKLKDIIYQVLSRNMILPSMEKKLYDQPTDSDIKRYEDIRKLTKGQGQDYTTRCLLDYEYIKNHNRLIALDLSRQKNKMLVQKKFSK